MKLAGRALSISSSLQPASQNLWKACAPSQPRCFGRGVGPEPALLDVDRQMMHALAAAGEEALDEARRARALDQLELPVADEEIGPDELVIVAGARLDAHADGEHAPEEGERRGDGLDRDRQVVDAESGKGRWHGDSDG